jgi:hypothetical protein
MEKDVKKGTNFTTKKKVNRRHATVKRIAKEKGKENGSEKKWKWNRIEILERRKKRRKGYFSMKKKEKLEEEEKRGTKEKRRK